MHLYVAMNPFSKDLLRLLLLGVATTTSCAMPYDDIDEADGLSDIGPARSCKWKYSEHGLGRFKNAATDLGFDPNFNMHVTVSRQGLTARVVGALSDDFLANYKGIEEFYGKEGVMMAISNDFPYVTPITQTTRHIAEEENPYHKSAAELDPSKGDVLRELKGDVMFTEVIDLPEDEYHVMIVYPISIALREKDGHKQYQGVAGNWVFNRAWRARDTAWVNKNDENDIRFEDMSHDKENYGYFPFGHFPFLGYAPTGGFAMHGPIATKYDMWNLERGEVSHGCNRMAGEHSVELAVLFGCAKNQGTRDSPTGSKACHDPDNDPKATLDDQHITVIEEFDLVPKDGLVVETGPLTSWDRVANEFVAVDVDYQRQPGSEDRLKGYFVKEDQSLLLDDQGRPYVLLNHTTQHRTTRSNNYKAMAPLKVFPTWDNRFDLINDEPLVVGESLDFKGYVCE